MKSIFKIKSSVDYGQRRKRERRKLKYHTYKNMGTGHLESSNYRIIKGHSTTTCK